jgi:hypothetical protein
MVATDNSNYFGKNLSINSMKIKTARLQKDLERFEELLCTNFIHDEQLIKYREMKYELLGIGDGEISFKENLQQIIN